MAEITLTCPSCRAQVNLPIEADISTFTCPECAFEGPIHDLDAFGADIKDPLIGQTVADWEVREKVGEGGFGSVYKAWDRNLQRDVALKVMLQSLTSNLEYVQKFIREAITAAQLNHPNIVGIHRVGRDEQRNLHFLVMEFLEGETLSDLIDRQGAMALDDAINIILQCADALAVAQEKNIIHRDIKPENIMIDKHGNVKITDFGLAKTLTTDMKSTKVMGTPHYMSPEQFEGKAVDGRTDIYSLGVTFYHMLTEAKPYAGTNTVQIIYSILTQEPKPVTDLKPDIPAEIWKIIRKMIAKDTADRYANFRDVQRDLKAYLEGTLAETIQCPSCAARNLRGRKFCSKCGTSLVVACPKCGNEEPSGAVHCGECGSNIEALLAIGQKMEEGRRLRENGDLQRALAAYQAVLEADPDHAEAEEAAKAIRSDLDRIEEKKSFVHQLLQAGESDRALAALQELLDEFPRMEELKTYGKTVRRTLVQRVVDAQVMVAEKALEEGDHDTAIRSFETALESDEGRKDIRDRLDELRRKIASADESLAGAKLALEQGRHADALNLAMEVLQFKPGHEEASHVLEEAKKSVQSVEAFVKKANEHLDRQEYDDAITRLEAAVRISPNDQNVRSLLGVAKRRRDELEQKVGLVRKLIEQQEYEKAIEGADEVLAVKDDHTAALALKFHAEELLAERERLDRCKALLRDANEAEKAGDLERAQDCCRKVLELETDYQGVADVMAGLEKKIEETSALRAQAAEQERNGDFELAVGTLRELQGILPGSEEVAALLAGVQSKLEEQDDTILRARAELEKKEYATAVELAERVLAASPQSIDAQGIKQEAERAMSLLEKHLSEAESLLGSELFDDASQELTKALDLGAKGEDVEKLQQLAEDGKVERLRSEATRSFVYEDYRAAEEQYTRILELREDDEEARKGLRMAERAAIRRQRESVLSKVLVAGLCVLGLVFVQFRAIKGQPVDVAQIDIELVRKGSTGSEGSETPDGPKPDTPIIDTGAVRKSEAEKLRESLYETEESRLVPGSVSDSGLAELLDGYRGALEKAGADETAERAKLEDSVRFLDLLREELAAGDASERIGILDRASGLAGADAVASRWRQGYVDARRRDAEDRIKRNVEEGLSRAQSLEAAKDWGRARQQYESLSPEDSAMQRQAEEGAAFAAVMEQASEGSPREILEVLGRARAKVGTVPSRRETRLAMLDERAKAEVERWRDSVADKEKEAEVDWGALAAEYQDIFDHEAVKSVEGLAEEVARYKDFADSMAAADVSYHEAESRVQGQYRESLDAFADAYDSFGGAERDAPGAERQERARTARARVVSSWVGAVAEKLKTVKQDSLTGEQFYELVITPLAEISMKTGKPPKKLFDEVTGR